MKLSTRLGIYAIAFSSFFSLQAKEDSLLDTQLNHGEIAIQQIKDVKAGKSGLITTGREFSHMLMDAYENYASLSSESKAYLAKLNDNLSNYKESYISSDGYFKIFYTTEGVDAVPDKDDDEDGNPDLIQNYARWMVDARNKYIEFGLPMPYTNSSNLNSYSIYIGNSLCSDNVYGYTSPLGDWGDFKCPSYVVLRSDYTGFGWGKPKGFADSVAAQITGAHEFQHSIQMNIANKNMTMFLKEGCAVWSEQFVYEGNQDPFSYIQNFLKMCNLGVNYDARTEYNPDGSTGDHYLYAYGSWVYFQYLTDRFGNEVIKELYNALINKKEIPAFDAVMKAHGSSLSEVTLNFYRTMLMFPNDPQQDSIYFSRGGELNKLSNVPALTVIQHHTTVGATPIELVSKNLAATKKMFNRLSTHNYRFITDRGAKIKVTPDAGNDSLVVSIIQFNKSNVNDFKITSVNAFGTPAEFSFAYDVNRPQVYMQIFNYTTKYTPKADSYSTNSTGYSINYQPDDNTNDVETPQFATDFSLSSIVPMPAIENSIMNINVTVPAMLNYNIYDMSGKIVKSESFYSNAGEVKYNMNLNGLTTGSYFIELSNGIKTEKMNFIVK